MMNKYAQIQDGIAWWVFLEECSLEELKRRFVPGMVFVDITGRTDVHEGDTYDPKTNTFTPAIAAEKSTGEKLSELDTEYQPQFLDLAQALGLATLSGNQTTIDGIKKDYASLKAEYDTKREAITNG